MNRLKIALLAVDSNYPNLALMKIARYYKNQGDHVEWYTPFEHYDFLYKSKIFTFTPDYGQVITNVEKDFIFEGGTGYNLTSELPPMVDKLQPDYNIYPQIDSKTAYGFLTRGCPNRCSWCIVPQKEGNIRPYMDIEEIAIEGRTNIILMDNNILASDYGLSQLEKIIRLGVKVDFNQGLDARLVTPEIAELLAKVKWIKRIRFGCDTPKQVDEVERATALIDSFGYKGEYFLYCILNQDINECYQRVNRWRTKPHMRYLPHCQPYRDFNNPHQVIPQWQKDMAHWADKKMIYTTTDFKDFYPRKNFCCKEYFK